MNEHLWIYDKNDDTWKTGESNNGMGVYQESDELSLFESYWYANIVVHSDIRLLGPFETKEIAIEEATKEYEKLQENQ